MHALLHAHAHARAHAYARAHAHVACLWYGYPCSGHTYTYTRGPACTMALAAWVVATRTTISILDLLLFGFAMVVPPAIAAAIATPLAAAAQARRLRS